MAKARMPLISVCWSQRQDDEEFVSLKSHGLHETCLKGKNLLARYSVDTNTCFSSLTTWVSPPESMVEGQSWLSKVIFLMHKNFYFWFSLFFFLNRVSLCILGCSKLTVKSRLVLNSWQSTCFSLLNTGITARSHYVLLPKASTIFLKFVKLSK